MANNLPEDLKHDWVDNDIVMPADVNTWSSATNDIKSVIPLYATAGNFYTATYSSNTYNLSPITVDGKTNVPPTAYIDGMSIVFKCPTDNQDNCKVKIGSLEAKSIYSLENVSLPAGKLKQGCYIELKFDNSNNCFKFQQDLNKANADEVVDLTSNQTIEGVKAFTEIIQGTVDKTLKDEYSNVISNTYVKKTDEQLHALKCYEDAGELLTDPEGLADVIKYAHSSYDNSKFTSYIHGTPTITSDGVMYGNYDNSVGSGLNMPTSLIVVGAENRIKMKYTYAKAGVSGFTQWLMFIRFDSDTTSYGVKITESNIINVTNIGGSQQDVYTTLVEGQSYIIELISDFKTYLKLNVDGVEVYSGTSSSLSYTACSMFHIGNNNSWQSTGYNVGAIDLKYLEIKNSGVPVFSGNKTGIDTIKPDDYTVVGSPTISDDGVASGFSNSNYIKTNFIIGENPFKIICPVYYLGAGQNSLLTFAGADWRNFVRLYGTSIRINATGTEIILNNLPSDGTKCLVIIEYNGTTYTYNLIKNDGTVLDTQTETSSSYPTGITGNIYIGVLADHTSSNIYSGKFDLNAFKIYVNGNLVYQPCLKIPYTKGSNKYSSKIVDAVYRDRVIDIYIQDYSQRYYTLQEEIKENYSVEGNPTIDNNFIASNFSISNYISPADKNIELNDYFELHLPLITNSKTTCDIYRGVHSGTYMFSMSMNSSGSVIFNMNDGNNHSLGSPIVIQGSKLVLGDEYIIVVKMKDQVCTYGYIHNGIYTQVGTKTDYLLDFPNTLDILYIGRGSSGNPVFDGSINLKELKIYNKDVLTYQAVIPPNFTNPMGEIYGMIEKRARDIAHPVGEPFYRFDDTIYEDEVRLEGAEVDKGLYLAIENKLAIYCTAGSTSDKICLPDFKNRTIWGVGSFGASGYIEAGLPNIKGSLTCDGGDDMISKHNLNASGALSSTMSTNSHNGTNSNSQSATRKISFNAHSSNSIYDDNITTVQPPSVKVRWLARWK